MAIFRIINKFFAFLYFLLKFRHFKTAFLLSHYQVGLLSVQPLTRKGDNIHFQNTNNTLPFTQFDTFKTQLTTLIKVLNSNGVKIEKILSTGFQMSSNGLIFNVLSVPNIATVKEVFIETIYDLSVPADNAVLIDIGLNVGYASLFFATKKEIKKIYSFEPFAQTYNEAKENIDLNGAVGNKIAIHNLGVSSYSGSIDVPQLESGSAVGSTDRNFIESNIANIKGTPSLVTVHVNSIDQIIRQVLTENPGSPIYIKMDCEGEEYAIMNSIEQHGLFDIISGFIIEWHIKGPEELTLMLVKNNFTTLHFPRHIDIGINEAKTGMIYAIK